PSSAAFLALTDQVPPTPPATTPCSISQMTVPLSSAPPCNTPPPFPLSSDPGTLNLFFVSNFTAPIAGSTLYGFSNICNNGAAISANTFFAPSPLNARPDTIAHELLHNL